jgi:hypothetical protein
MGMGRLRVGAHPNDGPKLRARLALDDAALLAECAVHTYRASGPGGQKRNKTSSAVRLHHAPSGLIVQAEESRSQHENRARALHRLREAIAIRYRAPLPAPPRLPGEFVDGERTLHVSMHNPRGSRVVATVLDALTLAGGQVAPAAEALGVTSSSLVRTLAGWPKAWVEANRIRTQAGLRALRSGP